MAKLHYSYLRALEVEGRHPADAGSWKITFLRLQSGEGLPTYRDLRSYVDHPEDTPLPPAPEIPESVPRLPRIACYKRIRSVPEVERYLDQTPEIGFSLEIFTSWANPLNGFIPMPDSLEAPLKNTHYVRVVKCDPKLRQFIFENRWSDWGDGGKGYLPYEYFDRYVFESYGFASVKLESRRERAADGVKEIRWVIRDEWDRRIYGYEINNKPKTDRWAWAFVVERDGALEIEEFYVRPEFRRRGYATRLSAGILELAKAKRMPLRLWVPFADSQQESPGNYPALVALTKRLGLQYQSCPVRWAAYYATNEQPGSDLPIEPPRIPPRPRCSRKDIMAAAAAVGILGGALALPETSSIVQQVISPAQQELHEHKSPATESLEVGTAAWDAMNVRRAELIQKKNRDSLTGEEDAELERLQRLSLEVVERSFERPALDWDRLRRLEENIQRGSSADEVQP